MTGVYIFMASLCPERVAVEGGAFRLTLKNLPPEGNALKELGHLLTHLPRGSLLMELFGGTNPEVIPDSAAAIICTGEQEKNWQEAFQTPLRHLRKKFNRPEIELVITDGHSSLEPLTQESHDRLVQLMADLACGVCKWNGKEVELTSNLASLKMKGSIFEFTHVIRYTQEAFLQMIYSIVEWHYTRIGCEIHVEEVLLQGQYAPLARAA